VSITSLTITNSRGKTLLNVVPNVHPATRVIARKDFSDESLVEYIQVSDNTINKKAIALNRRSVSTGP